MRLALVLRMMDSQEKGTKDEVTGMRMLLCMRGGAGGGSLLEE